MRNDRDRPLSHSNLTEISVVSFFLMIFSVVYRDNLILSGDASTLQLMLRLQFIEKIGVFAKSFATHSVDYFSILYCERNTRNTTSATDILNAFE
jgi:hypothetical protein